jgi:catechol 2,3-dioxygenase-like lactoylglutathione lyase family enzyme
MKRLHVHVAVRDLAQSVRFYSELFGAAPGVYHSDYARWMLEDPRVNFAISQRDRSPGVQHLGIQVEDHGELTEVRGRLRRAGGPVVEEGETTCCYARSEKSWIGDPQGIRWEMFLTAAQSGVYGTDEIRPETNGRLESAGAAGDAPGCCNPCGSQ